MNLSLFKMTRQEAVDDIIYGVGVVTPSHPYKEDVLFFDMLRKACDIKEWYEVSKYCVIHIELLEK